MLLRWSLTISGKYDFRFFDAGGVLRLVENKGFTRLSQFIYGIFIHNSSLRTSMEISICIFHVWKSMKKISLFLALDSLTRVLNSVLPPCPSSFFSSCFLLFFHRFALCSECLLCQSTSFLLLSYISSFLSILPCISLPQCFPALCPLSLISSYPPPFFSSLPSFLVVCLCCLFSGLILALPCCKNLFAWIYLIMNIKDWTLESFLEKSGIQKMLNQRFTNRKTSSRKVSVLTNLMNPSWWRAWGLLHNHFNQLFWSRNSSKHEGRWTSVEDSCPDAHINYWDICTPHFQI